MGRVRCSRLCPWQVHPGRTEGNISDDLQDSWEIDHPLCYTCLEDKHTQHKLQKHPIYTERGSEDCHWLSQDVQSSVDHLHIEAKMLKAREHSELLFAQYLAGCLEPGIVCHSITIRETHKRPMKESLFTRHSNTVEPMMLANNRKATLQEIHTDAVLLSTHSHGPC